MRRLIKLLRPQNHWKSVTSSSI